MTRRTEAVGIGAVAAASLVLGGATSFAQQVLPGPIAPFANSSSGWTALTAVLVAVSRLRGVAAAVAGAASFLLLVLGYVIVSTLRGHPDTETLFLIAAVVVGPFVGWAAGALHDRGTTAAVGAGLLAGVGLGDALFGLTTLTATTGSAYWIAIGIVAVALLAWVLLRRPRSARAAAIGVGVAAAVGVAQWVVFSLL